MYYLKYNYLGHHLDLSHLLKQNYVKTPTATEIATEI